MLETQSVSELVSNVFEILQRFYNILGKTLAYLGYFLGISWRYLGHIFLHHVAHLVCQFLQKFATKEEKVQDNQEHVCPILFSYGILTKELS